MKSKVMPFIAVLLGVSLAVASLGSQSYAMTRKKSGDSEIERGLWGNYISEKIDLTLSGKPGMSIELEHSFGDIDVKKGRNDGITITGEKRVSSKDSDLAREFLGLMELKVEEKGDGVVIKTYYPEEEYNKRTRKKIKNFSISYTINIPENVSLQMKNSFGNIVMDNISGQFSVTNSFGKVDAANLDGETELNNKFGSITAVRCGGNTRIGNEHGSLDIQHIRGDLVARNTFGPIKVVDVSGNAQITGGHGAVTAEEIVGDATIETSFSALTCANIGGRVTIRNSHGKVDVNGVENDTRITTSFQKAVVKNIRGNVTVESQHSPVEVANVLGDADVNTSFGHMNLTRIRGGVVATNQHGSVTAEDILPSGEDEGRLVRLKTSFGTMKLILPETLSAQLAVTTSQGKIESDFPITMKLRGTLSTSSTTQKIDGTVGSGKDRIEIEGSHSNIYLEKSGTGDWDFSDYVSLNSN